MICPHCGELASPGPLDVRQCAPRPSARNSTSSTMLARLKQWLSRRRTPNPPAHDREVVFRLHGNIPQIAFVNFRKRRPCEIERKVTHEYDEPLSPAEFEAAAARVLALQHSAPDELLEKHIEQAVHEYFCACAVDIGDQIENSRSGLHEAIAQEIRARVARGYPAREGQSAAFDEVDLNSDQSFPASDPPGWIWKRPGE